MYFEREKVRETDRASESVGEGERETETETETETERQRENPKQVPAVSTESNGGLGPMT